MSKTADQMTRNPIIPSHFSENSMSGCVLVVDDQPGNIQTVGTLLNSRGLDVMSATSAEQALQRLSARRPDVILLDLMMPDISGLDLCRRLQSKNTWNDIPVIFLSAAGDVTFITAALEAGAVDYITKPFYGDELLSRVRTHLALKTTRDQLRRTAQDKAELLGLITHDFKNHLSAMLLHSAWLRRQAGDESPEFRQAIETLHSETRRMDRSVRELLANEEAGREPLVIGSCNGKEIASQAVAALLPLALAKGQTLTLTTPKDPVLVHADSGAFRQVLDNVLSNAVKFSPPGGALSLVISVEPNEVIFTVGDSGPGFSDEDMTRVFGRYGRLSAQPTAGETATGLGLSIVKKLTEQMGGSASITSTSAGAKVILRMGHAKPVALNPV